MPTITVAITENGTSVGSGWLFVYGDSGTGVRETTAAGTIEISDVGASFKASMAFNVVDDAGTLRSGGAGLYVESGGVYQVST
tara:strand:- start:2023 stop:2271 length:249 start_codon:yes stop_codon:yes gene_type:complete